jgi:DNA-binding transcriptional ArsR family regulator
LFAKRTHLHLRVEPGESAVEDADVERLIGGPPRLAYDDIVRHPRLREAVVTYLDRFLAVYDGEPFLVRLLIEMGRVAIVQLAIAIEAGYEPASRETWPTPGRLKDLMAAFGLGSGRHVDDLIARLCEVGFLELVPSEHDRRTKLLKGTEKLWSHDRDWLAAHFAPLAICYPQYDYGPILRAEPTFQVAFRHASLPFLPLGAKLIQAVPEMTMFLQHAGGYPVIAALLRDVLASGDGLHAAMPYGDVGERFGVSRTHVRRLLSAAEDAGLVKLHARGGQRVEILPPLWACHDRGTAGGMYYHDLIFVQTVRALPVLAVTPAADPAAASPPYGRARLHRVK